MLRRRAFTLIELLVVIAIIAIIATILFPVFAQARDKARMSACLSNMKQIGAALMLYVQDYDETIPRVYFHEYSAPWYPDRRGRRINTWRNAIAPYLKRIEVLACPSNPFSRSTPGKPATIPPKPGDNADGWELAPGERMPISYTMNGCTTSWFPADSPDGRKAPNIRLAQLARPSATFIISEFMWPISHVNIDFLIAKELCPSLFTHAGPRMANFIFYDGHAKSKKWLATLYPVAENNWEIGEPNPSPTNRRLRCTEDGYWEVPSSPSAKEFQTRECQTYQ